MESGIAGTQGARAHVRAMSGVGAASPYWGSKMTQSNEAPGERNRSFASLWAALEELADLPMGDKASHTIAIAVGILMERYKIEPEEGFDLIVAIGQQKQLSVCDLASDLAMGGEPEARSALRIPVAG